MRRTYWQETFTRTYAGRRPSLQRSLQKIATGMDFFEKFRGLDRNTNGFTMVIGKMATIEFLRSWRNWETIAGAVITHVTKERGRKRCFEAVWFIKCEPQRYQKKEVLRFSKSVKDGINVSEFRCSKCGRRMKVRHTSIKYGQDRTISRLKLIFAKASRR